MMKNKTLAALFAASLAGTAFAGSLMPIAYHQTKGAAYDEIRAKQTLGRFVISPDGNFFLYEWARPYNWVGDEIRTLPKAHADRMQTNLFLVNTALNRTTSAYLFYPKPRATYYLGNLAPDGKHVTFYEYNQDDNRARAAAVAVDYTEFPTITWFSIDADKARLAEPAVWTSNSGILYPVKGKNARYARVELTDLEARAADAAPCVQCTGESVAREASAVRTTLADRQPDPTALTTELPKGAFMVGKSPLASLEVWAADNPDTLSLAFRRDNVAHLVFQNKRKPEKFVALEWPERKPDWAEKMLYPNGRAKDDPMHPDFDARKPGNPGYDPKAEQAQKEAEKANAEMLKSLSKSSKSK